MSKLFLIEEYLSFRESLQFTKKLKNYLLDENYFELQEFLLANPTKGDIIQGGSGLRKIRWRAKGARKKRRFSDNLLFCKRARLYLFFGHLRQERKGRFEQTTIKRIVRIGKRVVKTMNEKDFNELKQSVVEVGLMMRGELAPDREFKLKKNKKNSETFETWAICVSREDDELVPLKLYQIEVYPHLSKVAVKDESGETLVCPQDYFLPVKFKEQVTDYLKKVA